MHYAIFDNAKRTLLFFPPLRGALRYQALRLKWHIMQSTQWYFPVSTPPYKELLQGGNVYVTRSYLIAVNCGQSALT